MKELCEVQTMKGEGHILANLGTEHGLVAEPFEVDDENLGQLEDLGVLDAVPQFAALLARVHVVALEFVCTEEGGQAVVQRHGRPPQP